MDGIVEFTQGPATEDFGDDKFRFAVEACPHGMVMTDAAGRIVLVNSEAERLFGYQRDELLGEPIEVLLPARMRDAHLQYRAAFARQPETRRLGTGRDLLGLRRDGSEFPIEIGLNPIATGQGTLVLGLIVDSSERKRTDRLKDEFVSTVSHELRTPLTSIAGSLGLLVGGAAGRLPPTATRLISIAQINSQRLVRLINDLLDIEKIESGQVAFKFQRLDARALVEQVIELNRGYADGFRVRMRLDATAAAETYADSDRLAQVVTNLLSNAIKFSPPDGEVAVTIEQRDQAVRIAVRDHGPGIPAEFRARIFEKFAQADAGDARQKGGSGLGLSIVKQIVTRLGGTIGFEDAAGGGTVFYCELPAWAQVAAREIDVERSADAARILLCEDDPDTACALREGLRPAGFGVDFAHSSGDAVARARAIPYAAIAVDLDLPGDDGVGLIRVLRAQPESYNTPIIAMSADGSWDRGEGETAKLNVLECLAKPVNVDRLAQVLKRGIGRRPNGRPRILHVDDDRQVLDLVARALGSAAYVVSAGSIEEAHSALTAQQFDLAILDVSLGAVSGLDLLPDLRSRDGAPMPVIVFSAHATDLAANAQIAVSLNKSGSSLKELVAAVHDRLMLQCSPAGAKST